MRAMAILALCFFSFSAYGSSVSELYRTKALLAMDDARYEQALEALNLAVKSDRSDASAYFYRGIIYSTLGHHAKALRNLLQAKKYGADASVLSHELGLAYFHKQSYRKAASYFKQSLVWHSKHASSAYYLGLSHHFSGEADLALEALNRALEFSDKGAEPSVSDDFVILVQLAKAQVLQGMGAMNEARLLLRPIAENQQKSVFAEAAQALLGDKGGDEGAKKEKAKRYHLVLGVGGAYDSNAGIFPSDQPLPTLPLLPNTINKAENTRAQFSLSGDAQLWQAGDKVLVGGYQYFQNEHKNEYSDAFNVLGHTLGFDFRKNQQAGALGVSYGYSTLDLSGEKYTQINALTFYMARSHSDVRYSTAELIANKSDYLASGSNGRDSEAFSGHYRHYWLSKHSKDTQVYLGGRYTQENTRDKVNAYRLLGAEVGMQRGYNKYLFRAAVGFEQLLYDKALVRNLLGESLGFTRDDRRFDAQTSVSYQLAKHWSLSTSIIYNKNHSNDPAFEYQRWIITSQIEWKL